MLHLRKSASCAICIFAWLSFAMPLHAEKPPAPARKTEALGELQSRLESEKDKQADLKKKMVSAEAELEKDRKTMIALGQELQASESAMTLLEEKIAGLKTEQETLTKKLETSYGSMGDLILALQRIRRMPTETLVIRPGAPLETAQSAMLLQSILPALNTRAKQLSDDLTRLDTVEETRKADPARQRGVPAVRRLPSAT